LIGIGGARAAVLSIEERLSATEQEG